LSQESTPESGLPSETGLETGIAASNSGQLPARRRLSTYLREHRDARNKDGDHRRDLRAGLRRHIVKKIVLLAVGALAVSSPAFASLTNNSLTSNALTLNSLTLNSLTANALGHNSLTTNNVKASMVVTGRTVRAITLPSGERIPLH
jgi:hypothetical protein